MRSRRPPRPTGPSEDGGPPERASESDPITERDPEAQGSDLAEYHLDQVDLRFYGDVALVRATGSWKAKDGTPGLSRYVDIYARSGENWKVVSAQITRPAPGTPAAQAGRQG